MPFIQSGNATSLPQVFLDDRSPLLTASWCAQLSTCWPKKAIAFFRAIFDSGRSWLNT